MNPSSTGLLFDTRSRDLKEFKPRSSEIFLSATPQPFSYLDFESASQYVGKFPLESQGAEGSCVAHGRALASAIYRSLIKGQAYVQPSAAFIYRLRVNAPGPGMIAADANLITERDGVPAYADFPDLGNDNSVDAAPVSDALRASAKENTVKAWLTSDIPNDIDVIAGIVNGLGIALNFLTYGTVEEWSMETPMVVDRNLNQNEAPVRHCITVLPQSAYKDMEGKRFVIIQDSAFFGGYHFRYISEDWIKARCLRIDYPANLETVSSGSLTPYVFTSDLDVGSSGRDVINLQTALQQLGFFPSLFNGALFTPTGQYYGMTKKAVQDFQNAHTEEVLMPIGIPSGTGYFGHSTRACLNRILNP